MLFFAALLAREIDFTMVILIPSRETRILKEIPSKGMDHISHQTGKVGKIIIDFKYAIFGGGYDVSVPWRIFPMQSTKKKLCGRLFLEVLLVMI